MNEPKKIWVDGDELGWPDRPELYGVMQSAVSKEFGTPYIHEDVVLGLVEALKHIEAYEYVNSYVESVARAALKALEEE